MNQDQVWDRMIQLWQMRDEARAKGDAGMLEEVEREIDALTDS